MSTTESTAKWWLYFLISGTVMTIMLIMPDLRPWFWTILPFVVTTFSKALRII